MFILPQWKKKKKRLALEDPNTLSGLGTLSCPLCPVLKQAVYELSWESIYIFNFTKF